MSWLSDAVDQISGKKKVVGDIGKKIENVADAGKNVLGPGVQPKIEQEKRKNWEELRQQRQKDAEIGRAAGLKDFGEGSLGRTDSELMNRSRNIMQRGYSANEYQAARESRLRNLVRAQQQQQRQLQGRQASLGLRGGVAGSQYADLLGTQGRDRLQAEQELMLEQMGRQDKAAEELNKYITYDQGQAGKEKLGVLTRELAEMGLGSAERGAVISADAAAAAGQAMRNAGGGGKK